MKTKSEVLEELQKICDSINAETLGSTADEIRADVTTENHSGGAHISFSTVRCTYNGKNHPYAPDLDTREQALGKAQKLQREKEADPDVIWCDCDREVEGNGSNSYCVQWVSNCSGNMEKTFKFAETDDQ